MHHFRIGAVVVLSMALCGRPSVGADADREADVVSQIVARQERLANVSVAYQMTRTLTPPAFMRTPEFAKSIGGDLTVSVPSGEMIAKCSLRRAGDFFSFSRIPDSDVNTNGPPDLLPFVSARSSTRFEQRNGQAGIIWNESSLPPEMVVDLALGLRGDNDSEWLEADFWRSCSVAAGPMEVKLIRKRGESSLDVEDIWTFDQSKELALTEFVVRYRSRGADNWKENRRVVCSEFRPVSGMLLPFRAESTSFFHGEEGPPTVNTAYTLEMAEYSVGSVLEADDAFLIEWPNGAVIRDTRIDQQYVVRDGPAQLSDTEIRATHGASALGGQGAAQVGRPSGQMALWLIVLNAGIAVLVISYFAFRKRLR